MNEKDIVRRGYDKVSYAYRNKEKDAFSHDYISWLKELTPLLSHGAKVLDLGCGCGVPVSETLSKNFSVIGVDISPVQIERAEKFVPQAEFICADITETDFPAHTFAAIVSFFTIIHLPLEEQPDLFAKLYKWLQPEGYLLITVGNREWTGTEDDWLGVEGAKMFWSHADAETYKSWLSEAGFEILQAKFVPEGDGGHFLILAGKQSVSLS